MSKLERTAERRAFPVGPLKRISWGAIFGGSVLSVAVIAVLGVLGVAVGAMSMDASMGDISPRTMGVAAGIWWVASGMIAVFIGGLVASRLAGFGRRWEGPLHGIISWALTTVAAFALTTSVIVGMQHQGLRQRAIATPMEAGEFGISVLAAQSDLPEAVWRDVQREATQILRTSARHATVKPAVPIAPSDGEVSTMSDTFTIASDELEAAITGLYRAAKTAISEKDKMNLMDVLVHRTDIDRAAAKERVDRWAHQLNDAWLTAKQGLATTSRDLGETKLKMSAHVPQAVSQAAWFTFFYLLLSAIAAGLGGKIGAPNHRFREARMSSKAKDAPESE